MEKKNFQPNFILKFRVKANVKWSCHDHVKKEEKEKKMEKKIKMHRGVERNPDNVFDIAIYTALKTWTRRKRRRKISLHVSPSPNCS